MTDILVYEEVICTNDAVSVECWRAPLLSLPQGRYSSMYPPLYCTRRALTGAVFLSRAPTL
jgi:hypothetical protein